MLELKISTIIIEKDLEALNKTYAVLKDYSEFSIVAKAASAKQGLSLSTSVVPQLVFVNVNLADTNGLELIRTLYTRNIHPYVVFIDENSSYAFDSLELEPFDFFVLPLEPKLISEMIIRLKQKLKKDELMRKMDIFTKMQTVAPKRIFHQKKGIIILQLKEIVFCKSERTSTHIKLRSGENIILKTNITETFEIINDTDFIRTGRSFFINRTYLRKIDKKSLKCILYYHGKIWEVPISRNTMGIMEKLNVKPIY